MADPKDESAKSEEASETSMPGETLAAPTVATSAERILNQDEIDSLLGFDVNDDSLQDKSGVRAIINSALVSYERLPMLEIVFDRLVRLMTTSLRNFTSDNVEVSLDNITSIRFGDYLNSDSAAGPFWPCSAPNNSTITACSRSTRISSIRSSTCFWGVGAARPPCASKDALTRPSNARSSSA